MGEFIQIIFRSLCNFCLVLIDPLEISLYLTCIFLKLFGIYGEIVNFFFKSFMFLVQTSALPLHGILTRLQFVASIPKYLQRLIGFIQLFLYSSAHHWSAFALKVLLILIGFKPFFHKFPCISIWWLNLTSLAWLPLRSY